MDVTIHAMTLAYLDDPADDAARLVLADLYEELADGGPEDDPLAITLGLLRSGSPASVTVAGDQHTYLVWSDGSFSSVLPPSDGGIRSLYPRTNWTPGLGWQASPVE